MKKIFFKVCCLALLTAGNIACTGQGKINKGESAAADSVADKVKWCKRERVFISKCK